jgi:hypothetical protein
MTPGIYRERVSRWGINLLGITKADITVRPARIYPPFGSFFEMIQAHAWHVYDHLNNRYGETNVTNARNVANEHVEARFRTLAQALERLFNDGRFSEASRNWLRRGLDAAVAGATGAAAAGPYAAIAAAMIGMITSIINDLWPGRKMDLIAAWRQVVSECIPIERYLMWAYCRALAEACFRAEPGWNDPQQLPSDVWRWGIQPQPFGLNIVGAGPLGECTFLTQVLLEYDCFPEPENVAPTAEQIAQIHATADAMPNGADRDAARAAANRLSQPGTRIPDPLYVAYVSAVLCADHPENFYVRDCAHRRGLFGPGSNDPRVSRWIRGLWPAIKDRKVGELKSAATAMHLEGCSPTLYTNAINHALVEAEGTAA